jgi:prefoldin subunit 5
MSSEAADAAETKADQITALQSYLQTIMTKQDELKKLLSVKHEKAAAARRLSTLDRASLRNLMIERHDENHTIDCIETPGMQKRMEDYSHNVEELEKELEETTKLVNEVAIALTAISGAGSANWKCPIAKG